MNKSTITFHGGAGMVTGANFLLETDSVKILVDCGMVQGEKYCMGCNSDPFPYDTSKIQYLFITHAHIDHIGRVARLVKDGFSGIIYSTPGTKEIAKVMLTDSVRVLEQQAKKEGVLPLYEEKDAIKAISLWKDVPYHTPFSIEGGISVYFKDAGHILGSAMIEFTRENKKVVFTGDLGNTPTPLLRDTEEITDADYLIMESVYGDRNHETKEKRTELLRSIIEKTIKRGGALMIPAFSIERTQVLLYEINNLVEDKIIPEVPVFLDSPLAIKVTDIYKKRIKNFNAGVQEEIASGDDIFNFPRLKFTLESNESKAIAHVPNPKIIIAGSGMSNGGRILHHEKKYLPDPKSTLLLVGYQAAGSLGRQIQDGVKKVEIFDEKVSVRASIENIKAYSAHKDSDRLLEFVEKTSSTVKKVFVTMGEPKSSLFLVQRIRDYLDLDAVAPQQGDSFTIEF